jgi:DNA-binding NtrC family response regulator
MFNRELLRAELFGAEQGAFTTAVRRIIGAVESAHTGTLFLDEIGELSSDVQPALLTFLDRGEFERLGAYGQVRRADVRIVAATNKDLRAATRTGEFREDLWYRLAGQVVEVPPLRERPEDITAYLQGHRLAKLDAYEALSGGARERLLQHAWPGNFRELTSFAAHLPLHAGPESIGERDAMEILRDISIARPEPAKLEQPSGAAPGFSQLACRALQSFEQDHGRSLSRWEDVNVCLERYVKPLLFAQLSGAASLPDREHAEIATLARAIGADRGTVNKHLALYFDRFR